jgi:polyhydroxyalkanoate synthesis regulator phasin
MVAIFVGATMVRADECDNPGSLSDTVKIQQCIGAFNGIVDAISKANTTNAAQLAGLKNQITNLKSQLTNLDAQLDRLSKQVFERQVKIGIKQELLSAKVKQDYIRKREQPLLLMLFSSDNATTFFRDLSYREKLAHEDRRIIESVSQEVANLNEQTTNLKAQKTNLDALRVRVDQQASFLAAEVAKANQYVSDLSGKIAALSARQNEILAERNGNFIASIGDSELSDDYNSSIKGFRDSAPSGSFAVFSFGAYTHRKGMSQYGAKGRAQQGQSANTILHAYYGKDPVGKDTGGNISVTGVGSINFEDNYMMGIAEMPSSFPTEALKAQAIAARTYAYRYKTSGQSICTNEACQVFSSSKAANPPDAWKQAVQATRGQVLEDVVTYYSSTTGGYITTMGWDTTDGGGGSGFFDKTYEKIGASPWAYKAWYRQGYSPSGDTCGRPNPWLSGQEMADIVNAALVLTKGSADEASRITPVTTSCWGGNPYSMDELKNVASKYGGLSSASSVSVSQGNGSTSQVTVDGVGLSGEDFKKAFNLRAPGRLRIPQSGYAFFNVEHK